MEKPNQTIVVSPDAAPRLPRPERGVRLILKTHAFAYEGKAVAKREEDGFVVFVEGALAGETVEVEVFKSKSRYAESRLIKVIEASSDRRKPACEYFGICGGCAMQHITYAQQLVEKRNHVRELFERIGKFENPPVREVLGLESHEFHYRNKMEFSFSDERWLMPEEIGTGDVVDRFALGLHVRERFDRVLDVHSCLLPSPVAVEVLNFSRAFARDNDLGVFAPDKNPEGLLRFLVVRTSARKPEVMVNVVTSRYEEGMMTSYRDELLEKVPAVTTIVNTINSRRAQVATGEREELIYGTGYINDTIGNNTFRISANSFFQANTVQSELLYETACQFAELRPEDSLWDLYSGTGTITLFAAERVKTALGVELVESAVLDARENATRNGVGNAEFVASDLRTALTSEEFGAQYGKPSVIILDPPRSGMHPDVVREILTLRPERIAYISCNPATQARDIGMMRDIYDLVDLQPVDMFPQTYHIECVAKLRIKS